MEAILTIGAPASGKSTWAKQWVSESPDTRIQIERDIYRKTIFNLSDLKNYKYTREKENMVTETIYTTLENNATHMGRDVVISDTNLNEKFRMELMHHLKELGYNIKYKLFDVDLWTLLERDEKRCESVGRQVVYSFYIRMQEYLGKILTPVEFKPTLRNCYIFDIDGTLASHEGIRKPYEWDKVGLDKPIKGVVALLKTLYSDNRRIILLSGRDGSCREATEEWLINNNIPYDFLYMRGAGDNRKDVIIKKELYDKYIKDKYNVFGVFDDRPQVCLMWQELGLTLFKVGDIIKEF